MGREEVVIETKMFKTDLSTLSLRDKSQRNFPTKR